MLSINNLSLKIGKNSLFSNLSFTCLASAILYLCGDNGSGKTSLLRIIAGLQKCNIGSLSVGKGGLDIANLHKPYVTYIGHDLALKKDLSVIENLQFWANLHGTKNLLPAAITYLSLADILGKKCHMLSLGNQKLVAMARLILCPSKIWLLDELDTSLDEHYKELLVNLIATHSNSGGITIFATHQKQGIAAHQILNLNDFQSIYSTEQQI